MRRLVRTDNRPRLFFICQLFLLHIRVEKVRPYPSCCQSRPEECDDVSDAGDKCSPPSLAVVRHRNSKTKKEKKLFKFVRTVPTQLSTTTRGEKTYEINAKWGNRKNHLEPHQRQPAQGSFPTAQLNQSKLLALYIEKRAVSM